LEDDLDDINWMQKETIAAMALKIDEHEEECGEGYTLTGVAEDDIKRLENASTVVKSAFTQSMNRNPGFAMKIQHASSIINHQT
jgi:hypothetical protein